MKTREELAVNKLKEAMSNLIATKNIHQITIKEICEEANVNRSTFYHYFPDEMTLLDTLQDDATEKLRKKLLEDPIVGEESLCRYLNYIKANIDYFEPLFFSESCDRFRQQFIDGTFDMTAYCGEFGKKNIEYLSTFISHGSLAIIEDWIEGGFETKTEEVAHRLFRYNKALVEEESHPM